MAEDESKAEGQATESGADDAVQKKGDKAASGGGMGNQKITNIFLALNAVLLLTVAVLFLLSRTKDSKRASLQDIAAPAEAGQAGEAAAGKAEGEGGAKKDAEASNHFIKETFTVNLKDSKGSHIAKVDVEIEVEDDFVKEEVRKLSPRIRDFIVVTLSSKTYEQVESVDGRDFLREEIRNKINGYLTRGQIKNVYFTQFIMQ